MTCTARLRTRLENEIFVQSPDTVDEDDVSFTFDSNGRSVWVGALFGKSAPPMLRTVSDGDIQWSHLYEDQEGGDGEEDDES